MKKLLLVAILSITAFSVQAFNREVQLKGDLAKKLYNSLTVTAEPVMAITIYTVLKKQLPGLNCFSTTVLLRGETNFDCDIEADLDQEKLREIYSNLDLKEVLLHPYLDSSTRKTLGPLIFEKVEGFGALDKTFTYSLIVENYGVQPTPVPQISKVVVSGEKAKEIFDSLNVEAHNIIGFGANISIKSVSTLSCTKSEPVYFYTTISYTCEMSGELKQ